MGLRSLTCWDCAFESLWGHGYLSHVSVVCCLLGLTCRPEESYRVCAFAHVYVCHWVWSGTTVTLHLYWVGRRDRTKKEGRKERMKERILIVPKRYLHYFLASAKYCCGARSVMVLCFLSCLSLSVVQVLTTAISVLPSERLNRTMHVVCCSFLLFYSCWVIRTFMHCHDFPNPRPFLIRSEFRTRDLIALCGQNVGFLRVVPGGT